jgi:hypothetical protein
MGGEIKFMETINRNCKEWTIREVSYLKANYHLKTNRALANELGRPEGSITGKAFGLGLKKDRVSIGDAYVKAPKIHRTLSLMADLHTRPMTIEQIAAKYDLTNRSAYRYLGLIESLDGVSITKKDGMYSIKDRCPICGSNQQPHE